MYKTETLSWLGAAFRPAVLEIFSMDAIMNPEMYGQTLIHYLISSGKHLICLIFQDDSDARHTANAIKAYLNRKKHTVEHYPS